MDNHTPSQIIAIPLRTSLRPTNQSQSQRRSKSSANRVNVQPASPEVISSLISSFSAISPAPDQNFENLPFNPSWRESHSSRRFSGFDGDHNTYKIGSLDARYGVGYGRDNNLPWMNETVRSRSQGPNRRTPIQITSSVPTSPIGPSPKNRQERLYLNIEPHNSDDIQVPCSIGTPRIESGPVSPALSIKSASNVENGRLRPQRSLLFRTSRESMRKSDGDQKQMGNHEKNSQVKLKKRHSEDGNQRITCVDPLAVEPVVRPEPILTPPLIPLRASSARTSREKVSLPNGGASDFRVANKQVPPRNVSLRFSTGSTLTGTGVKSLDNEESGTVGDEYTRSDANGEDRQAVPKVLHDPLADEVDEVDEVSRRIEELKAQKEMRQRANETLHPSLSKHTTKSTFQRNRTDPGGEIAPRKPTTDRAPAKLEEGSANAYVRERHSVIKDGSLAIAGGPQIISMASDKVISIGEPTYRGTQRSTSRQSHRMSINSPEIHKRAFSNPLAQVIKHSQYGERPSTADSIDEAVNRYLSSPRLSQRIRHPNTGRIIAFSEVGDPKGCVIFCCVGMGLTRYLTAFYDELATTLKLRMITPDRPGIGDSEAYLDGSDTPLGWAGNRNSSIITFGNS